MEGGGGVSFLWVTETPHPIDHRWSIMEETGGGGCQIGPGSLSPRGWGGV